MTEKFWLEKWKVWSKKGHSGIRLEKILDTDFLVSPNPGPILHSCAEFKDSDEELLLQRPPLMREEQSIHVPVA